MSYSTFGYGGVYGSGGAQVTGAPATSPGSTGSGSNMSPSCGESSHHPAPSPLSSGRSLGSGMTDPMAGLATSQQQLDPSSLAALSYPRLGGGMVAPPSMYSSSYTSSDQSPYPSIAMDSSPAFYGSLASPYMKADSGGGGERMGEMGPWGAAMGAASLPATAGYYAGYDHPSLAAYGYGGGYDLAARRKNATRESTATLKAWLNEHKKNPYPTKGEKIMLAIITKMTLTQVSTWFANARRRLKKENKMTWEPKNKLDDEDVDVSDDEDRDNSFSRDDKSGDEGEDGRREQQSLREERDDSKEGIPIPPSKPKIWSMAELAVCKTPPPLPGGGQSWQHPGHLLSQGYPLESPLVRHNPAMAAIRSNMFGMQQQQQQQQQQQHGQRGQYQEQQHQLAKPEQLGEEQLGMGEASSQLEPHQLEGHPGQLEGHTGQLEGHPGQLEGHPGQLESHPGHPGHLEKHPGRLERHPGPLERHPRQLEGHHGQLEGLPGQLEGLPGQLEGHPGQLDGHPQGHLHETPPQTPPHPLLPYQYQGQYGGGGEGQFNSISSLATMSGQLYNNSASRL